MASTIVVCTDGSELAAGAADSGVAILRPGGRVLIVISAAIDRTLASDGSGHAGPTMSELQVLEQIRVEHEQADAIVSERRLRSVCPLTAATSSRAIRGRRCVTSLDRNKRAQS